MPIVDASHYATEAATQIVTYAQSDKFKFIAERMLHTPLYNDQDHIERVAIVKDRIVSFICVTLNWKTKISTSCSILSFEENPMTVKLLVSTAYHVFQLGFSEINFAAAKGNEKAVSMWDRMAQTFFVGGRSEEDFTVKTHTGVHEMITWRIFPRLDKIKAS